MGVQILNNSLNTPIWNITFISMFCLSCVVFLGLKLKWFRAQLRLGDGSTQRDTAAVQGVGFRMKTNAEDFQSYKSISEFTPILTQNETKLPQNNNNKTSNIITIKEKSANTNVATINKIYSRPVTQNIQNTNTEITPKPVAKKRMVNFDPHPVEITTPDLQITEEIPDNPKNIPVLSTKNPLASQTNVNNKNEKMGEYFMKNKSEEYSDYPKNIPVLSTKNPLATHPIVNNENEKKREYFMKNQTEEISDYPKNIPVLSTKNPLATQTIVNNKNEKIEEYSMKIKTEEISDNPKNIPVLSIKNPMATHNFLSIANENTKKKIEEKQEDYFMGNNNYSSAASIFLGGSAQPVQPKPRKFLEDEEASDGSETCA